MYSSKKVIEICNTIRHNKLCWYRSVMDGSKETERKKQNIHTVIIPDMHGRSYFNTKQIEGAEDRILHVLQ